MFGWFKKKSYELKVGIEQNKMPDDNISEPVISIVKSFSDKGRWKVKYDDRPLATSSWNGYKFTVTDTKTGEVYRISSRSCVNSFSSYSRYMIFPSGLKSYSLPSWMTDEERKYVISALIPITDKVSQRFKVIEDRQRSKDSKQAKVNQDKERQRLMDIYCNKES